MINDYEKFIEYLRTTGRLKLLPKILMELKINEAKESQRRVKTEIARQDDEADAKKAMSSYGIETESITINPTLISGWRILNTKKLIDGSAKRSLIEIYQKVIG